MRSDDSKWNDWDDRDKVDDAWARADAKWKSWPDELERDGAPEQGTGDQHDVKQQSWQSAYREAGPFLDVGLNLAATIVISLVVFLGGGSWLDKRFETDPLLTVVGAVLAFIAIGYRFYAGITQLTKLESRSPPAAGQDDSGK